MVSGLVLSTLEHRWAFGWAFWVPMTDYPTEMPCEILDGLGPDRLALGTGSRKFTWHFGRIDSQWGPAVPPEGPATLGSRYCFPTDHMKLF